MQALAKVMAACVPGVKAVQLCQLGDDAIEEATGKIYNNKTKDGAPRTQKTASHHRGPSRGRRHAARGRRM